MKKCISSGVSYLSNPPQSKCINCGRMWFENKSIPDCIVNDKLTEPLLSTAPQTWEEQRKNILNFVKEFPTQIANAVDSAYLAGLESCATEIKTALKEQRQGMIEEIEEYQKQYSNKGNYEQIAFLTCQDSIGIIKNYKKE